MEEFYRLSPLLFLLVFLTCIGVLFKRNIQRLPVPLISSSTIFVLLVVWTLLGFFTNYDYNQQWECIVTGEPVFSRENMLFTGLSLLLLTLGRFYQNYRIGIIALSLELVIWLCKLYFIKGGYAVGFAGVPSFEILTYDTIAMTLRMAFMIKVIQIPVNTIFVLIPVSVIMFVKVKFFV